MTPKLRAALDQIDEYLSDPSIGMEVSLIISAVRGPDEAEMDHYKDSTTNVIRREAFPLTFKKMFDVGTWASGPLSGNAGWSVNKTSEMLVTPNHALFRQKPYGAHFTSHVVQAAKVLGLIPHDPA